MEYPKDYINKVIQGDCLEVMKGLPDNCIDAVVTDPPYGLSFMGKKWDYDVPSQAIWEECLRVLKPGGYLLSFAGTRTQHRMAVRIEDAGFEIRDMIAWVYGQGFPKSLNIGKAVDKLRGNKREWISKSPFQASEEAERASEGKCQSGRTTHPDITKGTSEWEGWGTALKPSHEDITLAQKPLDSRSDIDYTGDIISKIILCLSQSSAKTAEKNLKSNQAEQKEDVGIAQWPVGKNINTPEDLQEAMDMSQSFIKENTSLNIVSSWLNILAEIWLVMNTPIIKTEISPTTELKILKSLEWGNILQNITQAKSNQTSGLSADACSAEILLNALRLKLNYIHEHFAQDIAIVSEKLKDLRPKLEPITVARKPLAEKTVAENCLKWGVGGINIDECRIGTTTRINSKSKIAVESNEIFKSYGEMQTEIKDYGRFPANLIWSCFEDEYMLKSNISVEDFKKLKDYFNGKKSQVLSEDMGET